MTDLDLTQPLVLDLRPPDEFPSEAGYYVVWERFGRPLNVWHSGREPRWRLNGSIVNAVRWAGPLPQVNNRTGRLEWPASTSS